ncbi:outer membrane protein, partial [Brevundimonas sp.]|uniref:outer membrane protein n=1 Tax=Brevundimonas sp. TaxID=1871086 RepID=UPI003A9101AB
MRVKTFILASSAAAALALSAGVAAAEPNGWYGALDAGWHLADAETDRGVDIEADGKWASFARLGFRFDQNWRVEVEGGMRRGPLADVTLAGSGADFACNVTPAAGACNAPEGEMEAVTLMVNTIYDFDFGSSTVRPFIGLGAGVNKVDTRIAGTLASNRARGFNANDSSSEMAAQALAGVAWAFNDRGHVDLTYRYLVSNMAFDASTTGPATTATYKGR